MRGASRRVNRPSAIKATAITIAAARKSRWRWNGMWGPCPPPTPSPTRKRLRVNNPNPRVASRARNTTTTVSAASKSRFTPRFIPTASSNQGRLPPRPREVLEKQKKHACRARGYADRCGRGGRAVGPFALPQSERERPVEAGLPRVIDQLMQFSTYACLGASVRASTVQACTLRRHWLRSLWAALGLGAGASRATREYATVVTR